MSTQWVTADCHFGHANILKFEPEVRKFQNVQDMNESMICEWNANVKPNDTVYILGDFAFCNEQEATRIATRLNGHKILIVGNHDRKLIKSADFCACFELVTPDHFMTYNGTYIHMYHYPITSWDRCGHGSVLLHGHTHSAKTGLEHLRARNVGYDATGKVVSKLHDVIADALTSTVQSHH